MEIDEKIIGRYEVMYHALRKRISGLEEKNRRLGELLFHTLELLRRQVENKFSDWKDADDWLFSELDFRKSEIEEIYAGRDALIYTGSAIDDESGNSAEMDKPLEADEVSLLSGLPIWIVPIGDADWNPQWRVCFESDPHGSALSKSKRASMYFLYLKDYGKTWEAYLYPPGSNAATNQITGSTDGFRCTGNIELKDPLAMEILQYLSKKGREAMGQESER